MAFYLALRNSRGLITRPRNNSVDLIVLFTTYTALQGLISALLVRLFPSSLSMRPWAFLLPRLIVWPVHFFILFILPCIFLSSSLSPPFSLLFPLLFLFPFFFFSSSLFSFLF